MTTQRPTLLINSSIFFIGSGWVKPSLRKLASGATSRACMKEMPEVMMPRSLLPGTTWLSEEVSFHSCISANFWRSFRWATLA